MLIERVENGLTRSPFCIIPHMGAVAPADLYTLALCFFFLYGTLNTWASRTWAFDSANFLPPLRPRGPRGLEPGQGAFADQLWITWAAGGPRRGTHQPPRAHPADFCPQGQRQGKVGLL